MKDVHVVDIQQHLYAISWGVVATDLVEASETAAAVMVVVVVSKMAKSEVTVQF